MEFYKVQSVEEVTDELILSLIDRYKANEVPRLQKLYQYYLGKNPEIINRKIADSQKPNNKIAHPIGSMITQSITGFFLGKPISYSSDNQDFMSKVQEIFDNNGEQYHNVSIEKQLSIYGIGYELLYMNELNEIKFTVINPEECFLIYLNSVEKVPLFAVRFYDVQNYLEDKVETFIEVYSSTSVKFYKQDKENLNLVEEKPHYFGDLPINQFLNNEEVNGDYEKVITLIDAFDQTVSNLANDLDLFADSYLILNGMSGTTTEDIAEMRNNRVILLDGENGSAEWLTKATSNQGIEQYMDRLKDNIHQMSCIPNFNDSRFSTSQSASALRYHLFGLETICSVKERMFENSIENRIKLITNILNILGGSYISSDIVMAFQRNIPTDWTLITDMVSKLKGTVSDKTLLSQIPIVHDVSYELELLQLQNEDNLYGTNNFTTTNTSTSDNTVV